MGKKKSAKAGGDFWDEDPELDTPQAEEFGVSESPAPEESSGVQEASMDDEWGDDSAGASGLMGALRRSKNKKNKKEAEEEAKKAAEKAAGEPELKIKSKKEKEKEKKEREKAKKKAAAQRKVTAPVLPKKKGGNGAENDGADSAEATPEADGEAAAEAAPAAAPAAKGGKKKKLNPALAALQKQLAAKKAAEEAQAAEEEALKRKIEEEERRAAEEEKAAEEARKLKAERKKAEREKLRAEGKLLSKKQQKEQAAARARREALFGTADPKAILSKNLRLPTKKSESKPKETIADDPEAVKAATAPQPVRQPEPEKEEPEVKEEKEEPKEASEDEALFDDWEAALEEDEAEAAAEPSEKAAEKAEKEPAETKAEAKAAEKPAEKAAAPAAETKSAAQPAAAVAQASGGNVLATAKVDAQRRTEIEAKRQSRHKKAADAASAADMRSPICAILGHVDVGKTKLLDNMRRTNVQEGEAGGITQQIGATYFPIDAIKKKTAVMAKHADIMYNVPGLLIIDTPGHESFTNLRSRGSSLCNIAILVVDIMHGLEPQTLESIRLLKDRKTPFVVALNKVDRLFGWESTTDNSFRDSLAKQSASVQAEFEDRLEKTKLAFAEQGFNAEVYYKNKNMSKYVSLIPTSANTGEGVPDLIYLLLELTQSRMSKQLMYLSELEATILEVKVIEGLGTTIDVVLSNGILRENDRIVLCGMNGPIATNVRALLTPQPMREMRVKGAYVHHKEVKAALGVKISANGLEHAVAGSRLLLVGPDDDEEDLMDDVMDDMTGLLDSIDTSGNGVCVQASTLGSLEALLDFLKDMKIPVNSISIGPVYKTDVMKAITMLDKAPEYAVMLCFDVKVDKEAEQYANENGIKIFQADIIYHLFDDFTQYQKDLLEKRRKDNAHDAIFPCVLKTIQIINKRNPMIVGVDVVEGSINIGTPICVVKTDPATKEKLTWNLGRVQSMEVDHKPRESVRKGQANAGVAVRLDAGNATNLPVWGRHIDEKDMLYSKLTRKSIDVLKDPAFRDDVARDDWLLIKKMKPLFDIK